MASLSAGARQLARADRQRPQQARLGRAAIASYYGSPEFKALAPSSQAVRRAVLERFGREHGDKMIAAMPTKFCAPCSTRWSRPPRRIGWPPSAR